MHMMEQIARDRLNKWENSGKVYYSIDDIPCWVQDRILAHSQQSIVMRMSGIVKELNHHYRGKGHFAILYDNVYFCDSGLNRLAEYFRHHYYFSDKEIDDFIDEVTSNGRLRNCS